MHGRTARGFTLFELMTVLAIVGLLTVLGLPKFTLIRDQNNVAGARARIESAVATARAAAIHKGRLSRFRISGNSISVWTQNPTTGAWEHQINWLNLRSIYPTVNLQVGGISDIYYEPRGLIYSAFKPASTVVFKVVGQSRRDSVCVTRMGQILPRGCKL